MTASIKLQGNGDSAHEREAITRRVELATWPAALRVLMAEARQAREAEQECFWRDVRQNLHPDLAPYLDPARIDHEDGTMTVLVRLPGACPILAHFTATATSDRGNWPGGIRWAQSRFSEDVPYQVAGHRGGIDCATLAEALDVAAREAGNAPPF